MPAAFLRVNKVITMLLSLVEPDVIKDEELRFSTEVSCIANAGIGEVGLSLLCHVTRILLIVLLRDGIHNVANHHQCRRICKRIEHEPAWIGDQKHIAFMDCCPATDAGAIHAKPILKGFLLELVNRKGNVVPNTGQVSEPDIYNLHVILGGKL